MSKVKDLYEMPRQSPGKPYHAVDYGAMSEPARKAWEAVWRDWAAGSPSTCDPDEAAEIEASLAAGDDPANTTLGEDARSWATDGTRVVMYQPGHVLRGSNIYHLFDGTRWFGDPESAESEHMHAVTDWDEWNDLLEKKILPALAEAYPRFRDEL